MPHKPISTPVIQGVPDHLENCQNGKIEQSTIALKKPEGVSTALSIPNKL